jgi:SAM-dependent methyltransferase
MAISSSHLTYFMENALLKRGDAILDIGAQEFRCPEDPNSINRFLQYFGADPYPQERIDEMHSDGTYVRDTFLRAGLRYNAIDINDAPGILRVDLDTDSLPRAHRGAYDLVCNFGTTEHVVNQLNAFRVIHDATAVGGLMLHSLPMADARHGLVSYGPNFFWAMAKTNQYEIVDHQGWVEPVDYAEFLREIRFNPMPPNVDLTQQVILTQQILMRRTTVAPFRRFFDSTYEPPARSGFVRRAANLAFRVFG